MGGHCIGGSRRVKKEMCLDRGWGERTEQFGGMGWKINNFRFGGFPLLVNSMKN